MAVMLVHEGLIEAVLLQRRSFVLVLRWLQKTALLIIVIIEDFVLAGNARYR